MGRPDLGGVHAQPGLHILFHRPDDRHCVVVKSQASVRFATGDVVQIVSGDRVTARLVLLFHDGSLDESSADGQLDIYPGRGLRMCGQQIGICSSE
jgi:hypothetical protein